MDITRYIIWGGLTVIYLVILFLIQYPLRKRRLIPVRILVLIVKIVADLALAYLLMVSEAPVMYVIEFYLAPLYVALSGDIAGDLLTLPVVLVRSRKNNAMLQNIVCMFCALIYLAFGTANMQIITANRTTFRSGKLHNRYKIVFVSDLHYGSAQGKDSVENMIVKISVDNPDLVILGGDIVDEYTTKEEMEHVFAEFGRLKVPVYFIYGNHDRQISYAAVGGRTYSDEDLTAALSSNDIIDVRDEWFYPGDDLMIMGREDVSSPDRKDPSFADFSSCDEFIVVADHTPYEFDENCKMSIDLQLSGHSHAGQIFPLEYLYKLAGYQAYGTYENGNAKLFVSSGAAGWCFPFRSQEGCHYEVITLEPEG